MISSPQVELDNLSEIGVVMWKEHIFVRSCGARTSLNSRIQYETWFARCAEYLSKDSFMIFDSTNSTTCESSHVVYSQH
jgi:hypothetical protein